MTYRYALGEVLREERERRGWTLRRVAEKVPMALGYLSEIERGHKELSSEFLDSLAHTYGLRSSQIVIEAGIRLATWEVPDSVPANFDKELVVGS
jgi:transcriptional regulator with XRE-family HTH domain